MISTRIYNLLQRATRKELNRFEKFIKSPYFNSNERILEFGLLALNSIRKGVVPPSKQVIWKQVLGDIPYLDVKYRKLCNDLLENYENFLIHEQLGIDSLLQTNLLLDAIKENKQSELIEKHITRSSKNIDREIDRSAEFFLQKYFYEKTIQSLRSNYERKTDKKGILKSLSFADMTENLDAFYVIEKLRHATDLLTWQKLYKTEAKVDMSIVMELVEKSDLSKNHAVKVYYSMFKVMSDDAEEHNYYDLKNLSSLNIESFPPKERREILDVLLSFCIKQANNGRDEYFKELLEVYDWGINEEIILEKGYLSPTTFRNYVMGGLRVGEFDRAEKFIDEKSELLKTDHRANAVHFNLARVSFYRKDFESVLTHLNLVNYDDLWYNVNSKTLLLAAYYELKEFEVMENQIDSFKTFLRREKSIEKTKKDLCNNFMNYLKKIHRLNDRGAASALRIKLNEERVVPNKPWLLEKIAELL